MSDKPEYPHVFAKCKRGNDPLTMGTHCPSTMAEKLSPDASQSVSFRCLQCKYVWTVAIGGSFTAC